MKIKQGRIIKGVGGLYYIAACGCVYECGARGIFRKKKLTPTIGDNVEFSVQSENEKKGTIEKILPRRNSLVRPRVANIDCAVITFAAKSPNINFDLLDRFLILAEYQKIGEIIICINAILSMPKLLKEFIHRCTVSSALRRRKTLA